MSPVCPCVIRFRARDLGLVPPPRGPAKPRSRWQFEVRQLRRSAMENKPAQNIQDSFLNTARKEKINITIYLLSGVKLTGRIRSFDKYSVRSEERRVGKECRSRWGRYAYIEKVM